MSCEGINIQRVRYKSKHGDYLVMEIASTEIFIATLLLQNIQIFKI